jgi:Protein of unknown function (DUF3575)
MTLVRTLAAVTALALAPLASAETPWRNTVTTNPARYALLHFQLEYERAFGERWSAFASPIAFHHAHWYPFAPSPDHTANGIGLDFGGRYFFLGSAPEGAFIGPFLSAYLAEVLHGETRTLSGYVFSPGLQGGYTLLVGRWVLSGGLGLSYGLATAEAPAGSSRAEQLPHYGLWINFRLNVGLAF